MSAYNPDNWVIVKITGTDPHYRVFGSWRGGYIQGDSWRMNSGIVSVEEDGDYYIFKGHSGSTYSCHKKCYGNLGPWNDSVVAGYVNNSGGHLEVLLEMPDVMNIDWIIKNERHLVNQ